MHSGSRTAPAILSEAGGHSELVAGPLVAAGFTLQHAAFEELAGRLDSGLYNVLLLGRFYTLRHTREQEAKCVEAFLASVKSFLSRGGGVFFAMPSGGVLKYDSLLGPYGARILELSIEQESVAAAPEMADYHFRAACTGGVDKRVGEGVDQVWYYTSMGSGLSTRPVWGDPARGWFPVLWGSPQSRTSTQGVGAGNSTIIVDPDQPSFASDVPIIQACQIGKGRLAVCGIPSGYCVDIPHCCPEAERIMHEGFDGRPSHLSRLLINLYGWLAESSLGVMGGAETDARTLQPQVPRYPEDPPVLWANPDFPPEDPSPRGGLIGARTALSTGSGSVAEYVAEAKRHGLDFLVFLEEFAALTAAKLERLKAECEAWSDESFLAVPGYTIEDVAGSHYFLYSYRIIMPSDDLLSEDKKRVAPGAVGGNMRNSRLENAHATLLFSDMDLRCRRGRYRYGASMIMVEENRFCDSAALVTWEDGEVVDDIRDHFRLIEKQSMRLNPTVLTLLHSPGDIARALADGWRNVFTEPYESLPAEVLRKYMAPELEWWGMIDEAFTRTPRFRFDNWQCSAPFQYVTQGPEIRTWAASVTGRDPSWRGPDTEIPPCADLFRNDIIHFRMRLHLHSEAGLEEVILFDGPRAIRRWRPNGELDFVRELDLAHHQQMHLSLEARDRGGRVAISQDFPTLRLDWCEFYCADRNNPLMLGYGKDADGNAYGWSGTLYLYYNNGPWGGAPHVNGRLWYNGDAIAPVPRSPLHDPTTPSDGGVGSVGGRLNIFPQVPGEETIMVRSRQEMISPDVAIDGLIMDRIYEPDWPWFFGRIVVGFGLYPSRESRHVELRRRSWIFRPQPDALTAMIYAFDFAWKEPPAFEAPFRMGWLTGETEHVLYRLDGSTLELPGLSTEPFSTIWKRGEYIVSWENGSRPAIFHNDGIDLELWRDAEGDPERLTRLNAQGQRLCLRLDPATVPCQVRIIAAGGSTDVTDPDIGRLFHGASGLVDEAAGSIEMRQGGQAGSRLLQELIAVDGAVVFHADTRRWLTAMPIAVSPLHEHWTVMLLDLASHRWRPLGCVDDAAWATLAAGGEWEVFIGHPVTSSCAEVVLNLVQVSATHFELEIHNPTDRLLRKVSVQPNPSFDMLSWAGATLDMQPGQSHTIQLEVK